MASLTQLLTQHGAASLDKQERLADLVGSADWHLDMAAGTLTFGGDQVFPMQVLGSEAHRPRTWLWAWANDASGIPEPLLHAAQQVRAYGEQTDVGEFTQAGFSLKIADGPLLTMIACGLCGADCYYRCPYEGGAAFLLLTAPPVRALDDGAAARFVRVYAQFVAQFPCDHRPALLAYAAFKGFRATDEGSAVVCTSPHGEAVRASFDARGRLAEITSTLTSAPARTAPEKKPWWKIGS